MTLRSLVRWLFARPVIRPTHKAPPWWRRAMEALVDRAAPTITAKPAGGKAERRRRFTPLPGERALKRMLRTGRFDPALLAFCLGGSCMGTAGSLLGALMPYHHQVAVTISVLWWGIYFGACGASICALAVHLTDRAPPQPPSTRGDAGMAPMEIGSGSVCSPIAGSRVLCAPLRTAKRDVRG
jgi:hypothetical protein